MTQDTRVIENRIKWTQDNAAAQATIKTNKDIGDSVVGAAGTLKRAVDSTVAPYKQLADAAEAAQKQSESLAQALNNQVAPATQAVAQNSQVATVALQKQAVQVQDLTDLYAGLAQQAKNTAPTIHDIGIQNNALPDPGFGSLPGEGGGGGIGSKLQGASRAAIALPGVGFQSPLVLGLRGLGTIAEKTGASVTELAAGVGIAGIAIIAITVAVAHFKEELAKSKAFLDGALGAQKNYYSALGELTTAQVDAQIATLKQGRAALEQQAAEAQNALESDFRQRSSGILGQASAIAQDVLGFSGYAQLKKASDDANVALQENAQTEVRLTQGRDAGAFAANDAADAEKKLADAREKVAEQIASLTDADAQNRQQLSSLRRNGTTDQVNEQLASDKDRETLLRNFLIPGVKSLGLNEEATSKRTQDLTTELQQLTDTDKLLLESVLPVIAQREAEAELLKLQKEASDDLNNSLQDINKAEVDAAQSAGKVADARAAIRQNEQEHSDKLEEIQATYDTATSDALRKKNDQLAKIDQSAAERQLQQRENDNFSIEQAVARGDIAAAQAIIAQQRIKTQQDQRQIQQQKTDADTAYKDQLTAANVQKEKLLETEANRYVKELNTRRAAYDQAVADQKALNDRLTALRAEYAFKQQYYANQEAAALAKVGAAVGAFAAQMNSYAAQINATNKNGLTWQNVPASQGASPEAVARLNAIYGGSKGPSSTLGSYSPLPAVSGYQPFPGSGRTIGTFDTPSYNLNPGIFRSLVPEAHIPIADFNRMGIGGGGGMTLTVNVNAPNSALTEAQYRQITREQLAPLVMDLAQKHQDLKHV